MSIATKRPSETDYARLLGAGIPDDEAKLAKLGTKPVTLPDDPEPITGEAAPSVLAARAILEHERQGRKARLAAITSIPRETSTGKTPAPVAAPLESAPGVPVLVAVSQGRTLQGAVKGRVLRQARLVRSLRSGDPEAVPALVGAIVRAKLAVLEAERRLAWALHAQGQLGFAGDRIVLQGKRDELTRARLAVTAAQDAWLAWQLGVIQ